MIIKAPHIDNRNQKALLDLTKELMAQYCPEWSNKAQIKSGQLDETLIQIFSRMTDIVIQRLNRVPDKNFLAFLDLMGIRVSPPRVARTPLCFSMAKGTSQYGFVPVGTQVAGETASKEEVIFETEEDLTVILPKLVKAVSIDPQNDCFRDHSPVLIDAESSETETLFTGTDPVVHRLYLGHDTLFAFKEESTITLAVTLKKNIGKIDGWEVKWYGHTDDITAPKSLTPDGGKDAWAVNNLLQSGRITFSKVSGLAEQTLSGFEKAGGSLKSWKSYWIYAELSTPIPQGMLPEIGFIQASTAIKPAAAVTPDLAFFNNLPVDLSKDFSPFGEKPKFNGTFYLGSQEVFAKEGASVTMKVALSDTSAPNTTAIKLIWEFCDGKKWVKIGETNQDGVIKADKDPYSFTDTTKAFTQSGQVDFVCPAIGAYTLNGEENYWIRVRIIGGNYGEEAKYQEQTADGKYPVSVEKGVKYKTVNGVRTALSTADRTEWIYIPATYQWPSLKSVNLKYELKPVFENIKTVLTYNDFLYQEQKLTSATAGDSFAPFGAVADRDPALYLAFDQDIATLPVNLFFPLERALSSVGQLSPSQSLPIVAWEYWNGKTWFNLSVEDETLNLTKPEMIRFPVPDDASSGLYFEKEYFWIRARLAQGSYAVFPKLPALYGNTVWGHNQITLREEILGSSNGKPDQSFLFAHSPVLSGQEVLVRETALTEEERKAILAEEGRDAVEESKDEAENITEVLVRWREVVHFHFSGPGSRHYVLDRNKGEIVFGDGIRGLIPPAGKDNIRCRQYQYGGGAKGNVAAQALSKLRKTFPYIASVTNPVEAEGGFDMEDLDHVRVRGPQTIKNRERAVTYEDFEWLVREASPKIALVKCLPLTDTGLKFKPGWITLILVPQSAEAKPLPSQELLSEIEEYLFARTSTYLTVYPSQINLLGPGYIKIGSEVSVAFTSMNQAKIIEGRITDALQTFFHPLRGGSEQKGWDFGRDVHISEVYEVVEKTAGVDYVKDLVLRAAVQIYTLEFKESVQLAYKLPAATEVQSIDGKICFILAETISANVVTQRVSITGFKEGDLIVLSHGKESIRLSVEAVAGDVLECMPFATGTSDTTYAPGSIVTTADKRIRSYTLNEVSSGSDTFFLKTAVFESGDKGVFHYRDKAPAFEAAAISDRVDTVYIEDHYLVYSGPHFVNRTVKEEPVFPYLFNSHTKELHDLKNEKPNCKIAKTLRVHRLFMRSVDQITFENKKMDYCRWCFGKEMSKEKVKG